MSDIFSLKTVNMTPELGMALKNFRIENKTTAKSIIEEFGKASSYISKLEKGDIKKVDGEFLIQLCNFITGSKNGLRQFLNKLAQNYTDYDNATKFTIMNIDDLLLDHNVPSKLVDEINSYLSSHNISVSLLTEKINSNEDIRNKEDYDNLPENLWFDKENDIDNAAIKFSLPTYYIEDFLNHKLITIHRVIAEGILYSLYKLGNKENKNDLHILALKKLESFHIFPARRVITVGQDEVEKLFSNLEPDTAEALKNVIDNLKAVTTLTKQYGAKRIKQISGNFDTDPGFFFAYMSTDITELERQDKEKKNAFLKELKELIGKYSQDDNGIEIYE